MESFIKSTSLKMWDIFENDFDFKPRGNWTEKEKNLFSLNIRAMQILYKGLTENDFQKIKHCSSARDIWNTLDVIYASNPSLESTAVQSSTRALCGSSTDELLEGDIEEAGFSEESIHFCLEDSESEYRWVPKHPSSALLVHERSRVPLTPKRRTRGDEIAETPGTIIRSNAQPPGTMVLSQG